MTHKFLIPVKLVYIIDDNELQVINIEDIEYIQEKFNVDLQFIIDEYEYKLDAEDQYLEDDDSFGVNKDELLQTVINDNWNEVVEYFNQEISISELDNNKLKSLLKIVKEKFNCDNITNEKIKSINIEGFNITNSSIILLVETENINDDVLLHEIESIFSEGWGMEFEDYDLSDYIGEELMYVYLKSWDINNPIQKFNI